MKKYKMIEEKIKHNILKNIWKSGEKIPSLRSLSLKYKVSPQTIHSAFKSLEKSGYISIIPAIGCFVKEKSQYKMSRQLKTIVKSYSDIENKAFHSINFTNTSLLYSYFNENFFLYFCQKMIRENSHFLNSSIVQDLPSLIACLSDSLEEDNIFTLEENIFITSGSETSIEIICRIFSEKKKLTIALSDPSHYNIINTLSPWLNIQGVHLLENGWDFEDFDRILQSEKIDFVFVSPNFQNPSGICWSEEKKFHLIDLAAKYDFYIIEEDNYSKLYYEKGIATSFKSLERIGKERIFYIRDFSSLFGSSLNISCVLVPPQFREQFLMEKLVLSVFPSKFQQKILETFIISGYLHFFMENLKKKLHYRSKYLIHLLQQIPELRIMHEPTGDFFIWIKLQQNIDEDVFYELCKEKGVLILPGYIFYKDQRNNAKFRICFASTSLHEIQIGIQCIKQVIEHLKH